MLNPNRAISDSRKEHFAVARPSDSATGHHLKPAHHQTLSLSRCPPTRTARPTRFRSQRHSPSPNQSIAADRFMIPMSGRTSYVRPFSPSNPNQIVCSKCAVLLQAPDVAVPTHIGAGASDAHIERRAYGLERERKSFGRRARGEAMEYNLARGRTSTQSMGKCRGNGRDIKKQLDERFRNIYDMLGCVPTRPTPIMRMCRWDNSQSGSVTMGNL